MFSGLGKIKFDGLMRIVDSITKDDMNMCINIWYKDNSGIMRQLRQIDFDNQEACNKAFEIIWTNLSAYGYCDLDRINRKTGLVMR